MLTEKSIQRLSTSLSADLGFSIFSQTLAALAQENSHDAESLIQAIFRAEGLDHQLVDRRLYRQVRDLVHKELGTPPKQEQPTAGT